MSRPVRIFCKAGELAGSSAEIAAEAILGRSSKATIRLDAPGISSRHARIRYADEDGSWRLEDLGSTNGTALDGVQVAGEERLGHLHVITLAGRYDFIFQDTELCSRRHGLEKPERAPSPAAALPIDGTQRVAKLPLLPGALGAPSQTPVDGTIRAELPRVVPGLLGGEAPKAEPVTEKKGFALEVRGAGESGTEESGRYELHEGENLLGRGDTADVRILIGNVSRRHALLRVTGDRVTVRDLGSSNHTYLNEVRIDTEVEVPLFARLRFGSVEARLIPRDGSKR